MSGWAVVAQVLRQRRDRTAMLDLLGFYDWLGDSNLNAIVRGMPLLPCRAGCAYCCYVGPDRPDLLPAELLRIVAFLRDKGSATALAEVEARLRQDFYATTQEAKPPCLFLSQSRCLIYPVRPMRCRAQHSPDRSACERHYLGQQATMPLIRDPALLFKSLQIGMRIGLHEAGLQNTRLALYSAMQIVLERPAALEQWLDGEAVFGDAALPEEADEGQFLVRLMQQSRGQVRAEARRLHPIIATLLERPGTWALYSTTGQVPPTLRAEPRGEA